MREPLKDRLERMNEQEQYDLFTQFEKRMQKVMDEEVYPELEWSPKRKGESGYHQDLIVIDKNFKTISLEEKFRTNIWSDFMIELMQDTRFYAPMRPSQYGWFYTSKADYIVYAMSRGIDARGPSSAYLIDLRKLRAKYPELIENGFNQKQIMSRHGKGFSFNVGFDWVELLNFGLAEKIL